MQKYVDRLTVIFLAGALLLAASCAQAQVLSPLYSFDDYTNDLHPGDGFLLFSNTLYGMASGSPYGGGGRSSPGQSGAIFKLNTDATGFTNFYIFSPVAQLSPGVYTNDDGANPEGRLVLSGDRLYGTTSQGGVYGNGNVFSVNTDGSGFSNLYNFSALASIDPSSNSDGGSPTAGLVLSGNTLYGTASIGGSLGGGTLFAINTDGTGFTNLYDFSLVNASRPQLKSGLVLSNNTLYGTTYVGGSSGNGTVFALATDGTGFTNLHSFSTLVQATNSDGAYPQAGLVLSGNILYGTATQGGSAMDTSGVRSFGGTVFALNIDGTGFTNLHSFNGGDGANPTAGLVLSGNALFGTTQVGGLRNDGTLFAMNTDGSGFATLHTFISGSSNPSGIYTNAGGWLPVGGLVLSGSILYGAAQDGGTNGHGTVFGLDLAASPPTILFTASPTNAILRPTVQFNCPAVDSGGNPILFWNWNFGDGSNSTSTVQNPAHTYTNAATFLPTLTCVNNNGDTVLGSGPAITAIPPPPIQFTANLTNGLPPLAVQFKSPGADAGSNTLLSWNWNFGDGSNSASSAQNPTHTYTNSGTFFPSLTCVNINGDTLTGFGPAIVVINSLLLNGGFETGTFANWTLSGYTNSSHVLSSFAHSGKYGAELAAPASGGSMGFLSQTVPTVSGASYDISFWLDIIFPSTTNDFQVSWNGNILLDETNLGSVGWTNFQLTVSATGTNSTLQFGYLTQIYFGLDDFSVTTGGPSQPQPRIAGVSLLGTNLLLNGTGGLPGRTYFLLTGTSLTEPLDQWLPVATNVPGADGNLTITASNAVNPTAPQRFFILQLQ